MKMQELTIEQIAKLRDHINETYNFLIERFNEERIEISIRSIIDDDTNTTYLLAEEIGEKEKMLKYFIIVEMLNFLKSEFNISNPKYFIKLSDTTIFIDELSNDFENFMEEIYK